MVKLIKKKYLAGMLAAVLTFVSVPAFVQAEEADYNHLKIAGISVDSSNAEDILGDGTVSYDVESNTLTLENADISMTKDSKNYAVYAKGNLNIVLKGENKLSSDYLYGIAIVDPENADSIHVMISGDGSLDSYGSDGGIFVKGSLTIDENVDVTGTCGEVTSGSAYGIRVNNDFTICGNTVVNAKSGSAPENSYGTYAGDNFTACCNAQLHTEGGKGKERSGGLYAISNIYVKDNAQVITLGAANHEPEKFASESYGIRTTHMYISGGTLTTTGQAATMSGLSAGIYTQDFELNGGTVNANSVDAGDALSIGIQSTKTFKIIDGTLNAVSGDTTTDSYAIEASGGFDVSGGVVNVVTGYGDSVHGIDAESVNITGGTVTVNNKGAVSQARGIRSNNDISISGGDVKVEVGEAEGRVFGIQAGAPVSITGGKVSVNTGNAEGGSAIYGWGDITITDAEINITSKGNGIYAPAGSVNIDCADAETNVTVSSQEYAVYGKNQINISEKLEIKIPENGIITQAQTEDGETYTYISAEDGTLAGEAVIAPIENTDDEEPGDIEEPGDDEEPGDIEEPDDVDTPEDMENTDDMEIPDAEEESEEMKESSSGENNTSVKTGDNTPIAALMLTSIVSLAIIIITARKKIKM